MTQTETPEMSTEEILLELKRNGVDRRTLIKVFGAEPVLSVFQ